MAQAGVSAREASRQVQRAVRHCMACMMRRVAQSGSYSCGSMTCDTLSGRCVRVSAPSFKRLCLWACQSKASSEEVTHTCNGRYKEGGTCAWRCRKGNCSAKDRRSLLLAVFVRRRRSGRGRGFGVMNADLNTLDCSAQPQQDTLGQS